MANYVYALRDPDTLKCYYVGVTSTPKLRFESHLTCFSNTDYTRRDAWIKALLVRQKKPIMEILQYYGLIREKRMVAETYWIKEMVRRGEPLTNTHKMPRL